MTLPRIELRTEKPRLVAGEKQTIDLLVRITPPAVETNGSQRPKLNIGIALDRSGSMGGAKMHEAREAAKYCVDQLLSTDRFSAVIFDDEVDVLFTNAPVTDREMLKRGLDRIQARNSTALHQGWVQAGLQVSEGLDPKAVNRVLLITDGQANVGETRVDELVRQSASAAERGVTTTTIGIGRDFNEDLLMPMAEAGQGNAWHVQEAADMAKIFETELNGLVRQVGHSARLSIHTAAGVRVVDMLNDLEKEGDAWKLPNLLAGSPLDLVFRLEINSSSASDGELATVTLRFNNQTDGAAVVQEEIFGAKFAGVVEVDRLEADAQVIESVRLLMNARARREAVERMDAGDYQGSQAILKSVLDVTRAAAASSPSAALLGELDELNDLSDRAAANQDPAMLRKMYSYQSDKRRKSR